MDKNIDYNNKLPIETVPSKDISNVNSDFLMSMKSLKIKEELDKIEEKIKNLAKEITKRLSNGEEEYNIKLAKNNNLHELIKYIVKKETKKKII